MGISIKDIFRKEEKYLGEAKDLPILASEQLSDERNFADFEKPTNDGNANEVPESLVSNTAAQSQKQILNENNNSANQQPSINQPVQQIQQAPFIQQMSSGMPMHYPPSPYPAMMPGYYGHGMPFMYPNAHPYPSGPYPTNQNPFDNLSNSSRIISENKFDLSIGTERGPLRKLLAELDKLESNWHNLTGQKSNLEKELKYLESDIEHKMKLLRTHLAIANESNIVKHGDEFHMCDGQVLKSRADLEAVASSMSKQIFEHHVGPGWNDFESWVSNCLHDYSLARRLKNIKSVIELQTSLKKY